MNAIFNSIFKICEPLGDKKFTSLIPDRSILYPLSYELTRSELDILVKVMTLVNDNAFYMSLIEKPIGKGFQNNWLIPVSDINIYFSIDKMYKGLENALYSPSGQWGIVFTVDDYAIIGGKEGFMTVFREYWHRSVEDQALEFLKDCHDESTRGGVDIRWVVELVKHIYGLEKANQLLQETGFS